MMSMRRRAEMKKKLVNPIFSTNFHCSTFPIFQKREFNILHPPRPVLSHLRPRSFVILTNFKLTREFNFEDQCGLVFFSIHHQSGDSQDSDDDNDCRDDDDKTRTRVNKVPLMSATTFYQTQNTFQNLLW